MQKSSIHPSLFQSIPDSAPNEEWRVVPGLPRVHVSSMGRVLVDGNLRNLYPQYGQRAIRPYLTFGHQYKKWLVHRLVALAFLGPSTLFVNHRNGIKFDNRACNLEYVTHSENVRHAYALGLNEAVRAAARKLTEQQVRSIKSALRRRVSQRSLALRYHVNKHTIWRIAHATSWKHIV